MEVPLRCSAAASHRPALPLLLLSGTVADAPQPPTCGHCQAPTPSTMLLQLPCEPIHRPSGVWAGGALVPTRAWHRCHRPMRAANDCAGESAGLLAVAGWLAGTAPWLLSICCVLLESLGRAAEAAFGRRYLSSPLHQAAPTTWMQKQLACPDPRCCRCCRTPVGCGTAPRVRRRWTGRRSTARQHVPLSMPDLVRLAAAVLLLPRHLAVWFEACAHFIEPTNGRGLQSKV